MKNALNLEGKIIIDGQRTGLNDHRRIQHYFGNSPLWVRSKPKKLYSSNRRFLS